MLLWLYVSCPPAATSIFIFPVVDAGAEGAEAGAVLEALEEPPAGGA